jgi:hypothetical protein
MLVPLRINIKFPKILGFLLVCFGLILGYSAFEVILDPNATVVVNDVVRSDMEAKIFALIIPALLITVGTVLNFSAGNTLSGFSKLRDEIYSGIFGK